MLKFALKKLLVLRQLNVSLYFTVKFKIVQRDRYAEQTEAVKIVRTGESQ